MALEWQKWLAAGFRWVVGAGRQGCRVARKGLRDGISECLALVVLVVIQMAWGIRPIDLAMAAMGARRSKSATMAKGQVALPLRHSDHFGHPCPTCSRASIRIVKTHLLRMLPEVPSHVQVHIFGAWSAQPVPARTALLRVSCSPAAVSRAIIVQT